MIPLVFAAWEQFSKDDFARVLEVISVLSFRYSVVSGLNTNLLEPTYHQAARRVPEGLTTTPSQVFESLKSIYVDDQKFEQDFALLAVDTSGQQKKLAKYILSRFESDLSGRACDPDTDPGTVEHILPENPSHGWEEHFPQDYWGPSVYRLGNLTLLELPKNKLAANLEYSSKKPIYAESGYATTQKVA